MDSIFGVEETIFAEGDDVSFGPLSIEGGFPFGSSVQTQTWVG